MRCTLRRLTLLVLIAASAGALQAQTAAGPGAAAATLARTLQDHDWTLQSATDAAGKPVESLLAPGHPFVMRFDGARLGVQGGCNLLSGGWRLSPQDQLVVGRMVATQMACEPPLMIADAALSALLAKPLSARVAPGETPTLRLESPEGTALAFSGRRTTRSLYGAPTRIFMEVAAHRVACSPAPQPTTTCLQVRERRFDDKGLAVGEPGPWQAFSGEIVGYAHQPGVSNVLRINRYKVPQPPADGSAYIYELDLVVESRVVDPK
jgi:heat shock protein HslJ